MQAQFFLRLVQRSVTNRMGKWLTATLAVGMGASLVSASLSLAVGMRAKMSQALRAYGANILLVPATGIEAAGTHPGASMSEDALGRLDEVSRRLPLLGYAPFLYTVAEIGSRRVILAGTWPDAVARVNPSWRLEGRQITDGGSRTEAILGISIAQKLGLALGAPLSLTVQGRERTLRVAGILNTGGSEDEQVLVTLRLAQELSGRPGQLSLVQVSAHTSDRRVEETSRALESALPGVTARTQLRLALAEERILGRISFLLGLIAALVLGASGLGVAAAMAASVLERTREIGLMKALGASPARVSRLFLAEAGAIGFAGGLSGGVAGLMLAQLIARSVFGGAVPVTPMAAVASVGLAVGLASLASLIPVRHAASIQPASVLRGE